ncbi:MAG: acyl-CoA thioesterase [Roseivirga sp.]|nr:acyl-CoA thioesterase [Roseivirga sp.]
MSRIKLKIPDTSLFSTEITVRISDINYGNHLGNEIVLSYMQETRLRFFRSLGYKDELNIEGIGTIQADAAIEYRGESFHGDIIRCTLFLGDIGKRSIDFYYVLENAVNGKLIARGKTGIAFYDYTLKTTVNIPQQLLEKVPRSAKLIS